MLRSFVLCLLVLLCSLVTLASTAGSPCHIAVLREDSSGLRIEFVELTEGEERVFASGEIVNVILPLGIGTSGDVLDGPYASNGYSVVCEDGVVQVTVMRRDGSTKVMPSLVLEEAARLDARVSVTSGSGAKRAFNIVGYEHVEEATGPVFDMFGGSIPLEEGEYSITSEIVEHVGAPPLEGAVPLAVENGQLLVAGSLSGGPPVWFVLDFGSGSSLVTREFLGEDAAIEPLYAVELTADGGVEQPSVMTGAGGEVGGYLGVTRGETLTLGDIELAGISLRVVESSLKTDELPIAGIIGLDLLQRASVASVGLGDGDRVLRLLGPEAGAGIPPGGRELAFSRAAGHLFVEGSVDGTDVSFLFDSGASASIMTRSLARTAGLSEGSLPDREFRGLDGNPLPADPVHVGDLVLGGESYGEFEMYAADLPVLDQIGVGGDGALLGIDFLLGFTRVDVDFEGSTIRLWPSAR